MGLTYDCWLFHPNLPELIQLARACPGTTIVANHVAQPLGVAEYRRKDAPDEPGGVGGPSDEVVEMWRAAITELASCSNVVMKLGGLGMPVCGFGWEKRATPPSSEELAKAMGPFIHHCIQAFGPSRCMFESNFPVDKASCSYTTLWNAFKRMATSFTPALSQEDWTLLFTGTAKRVYNIDTSNL
mmetsp:Transcript_57231/g.134706  ORF Transcript_57231/g.134706 Transcript_57231/m.134706 type:complete len:185 (+) Transcript_57231:574-1128(+)